MFLNDILLRPDIQAIRDRVRRSTLITDDENACWEWVRMTKKGYGVFSVYPGRKRVLAHRMTYALHHGALPEFIDGKPAWVLHTCDNPPCCNPKHLFLGTSRDNIDDMLAKGRSAKGEKHGRAVVTDSKVRLIRASNETSKTLAGKFGMSESGIAAIRSKANWRHIDPDAPKPARRRGAQIWSAKLTEAQVSAIRVDPRPHNAIATDYRIHPKTVSAIKRRLKWKYLP